MLAERIETTAHRLEQAWVSYQSGDRGRGRKIEGERQDGAAASSRSIGLLLCGSASVRRSRHDKGAGIQRHKPSSRRCLRRRLNDSPVYVLVHGRGRVVFHTCGSGRLPHSDNHCPPEQKSDFDDRERRTPRADNRLTCNARLHISSRRIGADLLVRVGSISRARRFGRWCSNGLGHCSQKPASRHPQAPGSGGRRRVTETVLAATAILALLKGEHEGSKVAGAVSEAAVSVPIRSRV